MLYVFRDKSKIYSDVLFNNFLNKKCNQESTSESNETSRYIIQTSGVVLETNLSFFAWIILLLIPYNNSYIINIVN